MALDGRGHPADEDIAGRLKEMPQELTQLVRHEIQLARAELSEKVEQVKSEVDKTRRQTNAEVQEIRSEAKRLGRKAGLGAGLLGAAGFLSVAAFATFTVVLIAVLAQVMPLWVSALIVTAGYGAMAGALGYAGKMKVKEVQRRIPEASGRLDRLKSMAGSTVSRIRDDIPLVPERTMQSIRNSKEELVAAWQRGSSSNGQASQAPRRDWTGMGTRTDEGGS